MDRALVSLSSRFDSPNEEESSGLEGQVPNASHGAQNDGMAQDVLECHQKALNQKVPQ